MYLTSVRKGSCRVSWLVSLLAGTLQARCQRRDRAENGLFFGFCSRGAHQRCPPEDSVGGSAARTEDITQCRFILPTDFEFRAHFTSVSIHFSIRAFSLSSCRTSWSSKTTPTSPSSSPTTWRRRATASSASSSGADVLPSLRKAAGRSRHPRPDAAGHGWPARLPGDAGRSGHGGDPDHHADGAGRGSRPRSGLELGADDYVTKPFSPKELDGARRGAPPPRRRKQHRRAARLRADHDRRRPPHGRPRRRRRCA